VLAAESARAAALVAGDVAALATLLAPELHYVHATGLCHDRTALLDWLVTRAPRFLAVGLEQAPAQPQVQALAPGLALLTGTLVMRLQRPELPAPVAARSWLSQLWQQGADGRWRLRLLHSTQSAG
jgi:hypothetical protein